MNLIRTAAGRDSAEPAGSDECLLEVVLELFIREFSCLNTTPDQVVSWVWLRVKVIDHGPQSTSDAISHHRIADLSANRVRHSNPLILATSGYE